MDTPFAKYEFQMTVILDIIMKDDNLFDIDDDSDDSCETLVVNVLKEN